MPHFYLIYTPSTENSSETHFWASTHRLRTTALTDCIWSLILQIALISWRISDAGNCRMGLLFKKGENRAGLLRTVEFYGIHTVIQDRCPVRLYAHWHREELFALISPCSRACRVNVFIEIKAPSGACTCWQFTDNLWHYFPFIPSTPSMFMMRSDLLSISALMREPCRLFMIKCSVARGAT